jgi:hypothetical protein
MKACQKTDEGFRAYWKKLMVSMEVKEECRLGLVEHC